MCVCLRWSLCLPSLLLAVFKYDGGLFRLFLRFLLRMPFLFSEMHQFGPKDGATLKDSGAKKHCDEDLTVFSSTHEIAEEGGMTINRHYHKAN